MLAGKPVLQHVLERVKQIRGPIKYKQPKVIIAVPDTPQSEVMLQLAEELGVDNFCGSENNVLERYFEAARFFKFDVIVRVTGDCPLINPKLCSEVLQLLIWRKVDYASNCHEQRTFPKGLDCEAFTFDCLEMAYFMVKEELNKQQTAMNNPKGHILAAPILLKNAKYDAEHVTPWMIRESEVKKALVKQKQNKSRVNLCVDRPEDIAKLEKYLSKIEVKSANDN